VNDSKLSVSVRAEFYISVGRNVVKKFLRFVSVTIHKNINIVLRQQFNIISDGIIICKISGLYSTLQHGYLLTFNSELCVILNSYPKLDKSTKNIVHLSVVSLWYESFIPL